MIGVQGPHIHVRRHIEFWQRLALKDLRHQDRSRIFFCPCSNAIAQRRIGAMLEPEPEPAKAPAHDRTRAASALDRGAVLRVLSQPAYGVSS